MNTILATLLLFNLGLIGALPRVFFRSGKLNLSWWLTATPFFVASVSVLAAATGLFEPRLPESGLLSSGLWIVATLLSAGSIGLIGLTCGTHRRPISLWHQKNDGPEGIVTEGPYAHVRHPFYAAFLLALSAVAISVPHVLTAVVLVYGFLILNGTAAREERRLCSSNFGEEYRAYIGRTGRFHPRLRGLVR